MNDRRRQVMLVAGVVAVLVAAVVITNITTSIERMLVPKRVEDSVSKMFESNDSRSSQIGKRGLDRVMLQMEMPRSASEVRDLAPAKTRGLWRRSLYWDFLFIAGYVLLFAGVIFSETVPATLWERPAFCAAMAALADGVENALLLRILDYFDAGESIAGRRTLLALLIASAVKWLLYFLCVRAVSIQMENTPEWRSVAPVLRAAATAGSWTAILVLLGLPGRALLALMAAFTVATLLVAAVMRIWRGRTRRLVEATG